MKLQILVPHYHEPAEVIEPLLDSLAIQQGISMADIGVIICHDGKDIPNLEFSRTYPFQIIQISIDHKGVSAARNAALDAATADYVMFCDADDMFCNVCGLWIVFNEINNSGFDSLVSQFMEESKLPQDIPNNPQFGQVYNFKKGDTLYINHDLDTTFVHGKIHRRQYLIDKQIRWNEALTIHEDSFFNILCQNLSTNVKYCPTPFYLWKWRDESVCRHDPKYILKTYRNMIDSNEALIGEFLKRGIQDKAAFFSCFMVFDAYYLMNKPEWKNQENKTYRDETELHFANYFRKHKDLWNALTPKEKMMISNQVRTRSVNEGMMMEAMTIDAWLRHISKLK